MASRFVDSTKNIKGNRLVLVAEVVSFKVFKLPDGLDLEDKAIVKEYEVECDTLTIQYVDGREEEIELGWEDENDFKHPMISETFLRTADDVGMEFLYEDEDEEEEDEEKKDEEKKEE